MTFRGYLRNESKYFFSLRIIAIPLVFFILCGFLIQKGLWQYKHIMREISDFQDFERTKLKQFVFLNQYGDYGLRLLFVPSPFMAFFDGGPVPNLMTAFIDTSERMEIYQPLKSQNAFSKFNNPFMNFAGFVMLIGSILALLYGFEAFMRHSWLKFVEDKLRSRKKLFFFVISSRILILLFICLFIGVISFLLFLLNAVSINPGQLFGYSLIYFGILLFFLFVGFCCGAAKSKITGGVALAVSWFLLAFIIPLIIHQWVFSKAASIGSIYNMEKRKLVNFMNYERTSYEEAGKFDPSKRGSQKEKDMFMAFWNSGFKCIMEDEQKILDETKSHIDFYQTITGIFPSTFYLSVSCEISSQGFSSMVGFNEYTQDVKKDFFWFRAENYIFSDKKEFKPFINGDENLYRGKSQLPNKFGFGVVASMLWFTLLFLFSWNRFNRMLDRSRGPETQLELNPEDLQENRTNIMFTSDKGLLPQLIAKLNFRHIPFVQVPGPDSLPGDVKVKNVFSLFGQAVPAALEEIAGKYPYGLDADQQAKVLVELTKSHPAGIFIFDNFLTGLSDDFIAYFAGVLKELKKERTIVYFTNSQWVTALIGDCGIRWTTEKIPF